MRRAERNTMTSRSIWMIWRIRRLALGAHAACGLAVALMLSSCSSGGSVASGSIVQTVSTAFHGIGGKSITREDVQAIPFASIGFAVGDDSEQMLILAGTDKGDMVWTSSAKITLVTRNGRIVRSIGLEHDLR